MPNESVIKLFEDKKIRIVWNEEEEKYYFAVADIVSILTDSADIKQYIKRITDIRSHHFSKNQRIHLYKH